MRPWRQHAAGRADSSCGHEPRVPHEPPLRAPQQGSGWLRMTWILERTKCGPSSGPLSCCPAGGHQGLSPLAPGGFRLPVTSQSMPWPLPQGAQVWSQCCSAPGSASSPVKSTFPVRGCTEEAEGPSWPVVCRACPGTRCVQEQCTWPQRHFARPGVGLRVQAASWGPWWWAPRRRDQGPST